MLILEILVIQFFQYKGFITGLVPKEFFKKTAIFRSLLHLETVAQRCFVGQICAFTKTKSSNIRRPVYNSLLTDIPLSILCTLVHTSCVHSLFFLGISLCHCTLLMLYYLHVTHFSYYAYFMLHNFHESLFLSLSMFSSDYIFFYVELSLYCTYSVLHFLHVVFISFAFISCCTFSVLHSLYVLLLPC